MANSRGVVFGYEVRTDLDLVYLRSGSGQEITVQEGSVHPPGEAEPIMTWRPREGNPFEADLFEIAGGFALQIPTLGSYAVEPSIPRITVPVGADPVSREERLWGIPMALCLAARGDLPLHAAAVQVADVALLFCGPSRFGKTTLAAAFLRRGHRVLAEDMTCARPGMQPAVVPGPAMLRVRHDVALTLGPIPGTSTVSTDQDRIHLRLDAGLRGDGAPVPLAGIVVLRRGTPDIQLYRVQPERFFPELFTVSFVMPTERDRERSFATLVDIASAVPVWLLDRPLRAELLDEVVARVVEACVP